MCSNLVWLYFFCSFIILDHDKKGFRFMSYALSAIAMIIAAISSYGIIIGTDVLPKLTGPVLRVVIIVASFGYGFATRNKRNISCNSQDITGTKDAKT